MHRRHFLKGTAVAGAAGAATTTFAAPAISQGRIEWRMVTTWPKNFPGLGTGAELLAQLITKASEGRLSVRVFGGGELVPPFEAMDAVASGSVEMGHGSPYYWKGKIAAVQFLTTFPFGLLAAEQNAWFRYGDGQAIADELYRQMGCKFFPSGNTGTQMGGWFNKEINSLEDYKGLKMRIPGLGGEVVKAAGGNVVNLPGAEIPPALQSGAVDAVEWVGPYNDLAFGLYKSAKYYYYPGWHEPGSTLDNFINLAAWEKLPADLQAIVEAANAAVNGWVLSEFVARNNTALQTLIHDHGVALRKFPDPVLEGLGKLSGEVLADLAGKDEASRKVMDSLLRFRANAMAWTNLSESAFSQARALPYPFAKANAG
ncbi:MAG: TRAP transporter substrate-binding protein [Rhodospirillales bacterium]|nr:TRAP transporter substrate-binding protein [Rhodospirillales bacterium]